jgi:hypothetical protein
MALGGVEAVLVYFLNRDHAYGGMIVSSLGVIFSELTLLFVGIRGWQLKGMALKPWTRWSTGASIVHWSLRILTLFLFLQLLLLVYLVLIMFGVVPALYVPLVGEDVKDWVGGTFSKGQSLSWGAYATATPGRAELRVLGPGALALGLLSLAMLWALPTPKFKPKEPEVLVVKPGSAKGSRDLSLDHIRNGCGEGIAEQPQRTTHLSPTNAGHVFPPFAQANAAPSHQTLHPPKGNHYPEGMPPGSSGPIAPKGPAFHEGGRSAFHEGGRNASPAHFAPVHASPVHGRQVPEPPPQRMPCSQQPKTYAGPPDTHNFNSSNTYLPDGRKLHDMSQRSEQHLHAPGMEPKARSTRKGDLLMRSAENHENQSSPTRPRRPFSPYSDLYSLRQGSRSEEYANSSLGPSSVRSHLAKSSAPSEADSQFFKLATTPQSARFDKIEPQLFVAQSMYLSDDEDGIEYAP